MGSRDLGRQWWAAVVDNIRSRSTATFNHWFSGVQLESLEGNLVVLRASDPFVQQWVQEHFVPSILEELRRISGHEFSLQWSDNHEIEEPIAEPVRTHSPVVPRAIHVLSDDPPPSSSTPTAAPYPPSGNEGTNQSSKSATSPSADSSQLIASLQLNDLYTFDNFVVGPSNQLAFAASIAAAGGNGRRYNPLFLYGSTGLGKTHLLQAIVHEIRRTRPGARIVYGSADSFTSAYIRALQEKSMERFREAYHNCDVLLLDDVQSLGGRPQTQEELFNTFNALHARGTQIVLAADKNPRDLNRMEQRLVSRFTWGLVADIQSPELETRVAIVKKKAALEHADIPEEVALLLAQKCQTNVRELEGCLIRLVAKAFVLRRKIDLDFAREELQETVSVPMPLSPERIQRVVGTMMHVDPAAIIGKGRQRSVAQARHIAMYVCRQRLGASYPEIGKLFGGRDHSTVMSAVKKIEKRMEQDPAFRALLEKILQNLGSTNDR